MTRKKHDLITNKTNKVLENQQTLTCYPQMEQLKASWDLKGKGLGFFRDCSLTHLQDNHQLLTPTYARTHKFGVQNGLYEVFSEVKYMNKAVFLSD